MTLRGDIAEVASGEANSRPAFERVLEGYDIEVDGELKIAASIYYHRYLARTSNGPSADHLRELVDALYAVGPDLHERRAAAFAGMLLLGRADDIAPMIEHGDKPLHIRSGTGYGNESDSLMALMCERWVMAGEIALERLQRAGEARVTAGGRDFGNHYDLAAHLLAADATLRGPEANTAIGRVDLLFELLNRLGLATPNRLKPYFRGIAPRHGAPPLCRTNY